MLKVPLSSVQRHYTLVIGLVLLNLPGHGLPVALTPLHPHLRVRPVAPHVFVSCTPGGQGSSNGLLVQTPQGVLAVDAASSAGQAEQLIRWATDSLHQRIRLLVLTHAQAATPEALAVFRQHRVRVYSSPLTAQRWQLGHPQAPALTPALQPYTVIRAGRTRLELFFPGPGFSPDNVVAWLPKYKVLYGGELVLAQPPATPLPTNPATRKQWAATLRNLAGRYQRARVVVPAHGPVGSLALLERTQQQLKVPVYHKPAPVPGPAAATGRR
ncbi:MBL fold metallo-hydrolase [Hymenobacter endophyticus]|uniref:Metallo-beta-lactamase domain-containing protein n=1 Tax=Hymenobacter endophyticus TaxID=3076335 RepID=A0ABU3TED2_9BACT|nr:hypothetical protein [Hymenobacter endophyticus]MDU0369702.1 hypothetical protein [Hymenobacter endophyticus]